MRERIEKVTGDKEIYKARRNEFETREKVPFRVSSSPLTLTPMEKTELENIGNDVVAYFKVINELYAADSQIREILDKGKPDIFLIQKPMRYLFVRPDIIITNDGFRICEIETSPFGLALAEILNRAYRQAGFETLVTEDTLTRLVHEHTPSDGRIIYSKKTAAYSGQLDFLAENIFSGKERKWITSPTGEVESELVENIYRGFYLSEYLEDPEVASVLQQQIESESVTIPSITPHMEEKAILSFIWDKRFEDYLKKQLGPATFANLRKVIPPNWIVGQEEHFAPGLPGNMSSSAGLANLSRAKRAFVLKTSGFSTSNSWAEGVNFLHTKSSDNATRLLNLAEQDKATLHVVQEFTKGTIKPMHYTNDRGEEVPMSARVRLTPYFSAESGSEGRLVAIKATARENTDYIHASSDSINTAVN